MSRQPICSAAAVAGTARWHPQAPRASAWAFRLRNSTSSSALAARKRPSTRNRRSIAARSAALNSSVIGPH